MCTVHQYRYPVEIVTNLSVKVYLVEVLTNLSIKVYPIEILSNSNVKVYFGIHPSGHLYSCV